VTKTDRFKTYSQLEKICKRILSRSVPDPDEILKLEAEYREVLLALAGDSILKNISSDVPTLPRWYPVGGINSAQLP
jgi:hypothetical protein